MLLTDLMMPGMDGQELLATARALRPDVEVVLMTAYGTVEAAVSAMKDGAYDFLTKPLKRHVLVKTVEKALERHALRAENQELKARLADLGAQRQPGGTVARVPLLPRHAEAGRALDGDGAPPRRVRDRQGARRARAPRALRPRQAARSSP